MLSKTQLISSTLFIRSCW